jgi:hypothetical protein
VAPALLSCGGLRWPSPSLLTAPPRPQGEENERERGWRVGDSELPGGVPFPQVTETVPAWLSAAVTQTWHRGHLSVSPAVPSSASSCLVVATQVSSG